MGSSGINAEYMGDHVRHHGTRDSLNEMNFASVVGVAKVANVAQKKAAVVSKRKKLISYNIMVVGRSGMGKSTLVHTLLGQPMVAARDPAVINKTTDINVITEDIMLEEIGNTTVSVIDTPGFGDQIDSKNSFKEINNYIEDQFQRFLEAESRIRRDTKFMDTRVHVMLYFVSPHAGIKEIDRKFIQQLGKRVDIILVIAKSDTLTKNEMALRKKQILAQVKKYDLSVYQFPTFPDDEPEVIEEAKELREKMPFACIGGEIDSEENFFRSYPWGKINIYDGQSCDMESLRLLLLCTHLELFKDSCNDIHYENFRSEQLSQAGVIDSSKIEQELQAKEKMKKEASEAPEEKKKKKKEKKDDE
eukprot:Lithocolla_globosa_v1_NODE_6093_length_1137_cov_69.668207.p1 type:complete len:361 gc:universal NODE_6093_length_1137_cov_69.668207:1-1083(+)